MRLIDADELMEHVGRDRLDSRELIMDMVKNAPTVKPASYMETDAIPISWLELYTRVKCTESWHNMALEISNAWKAYVELMKIQIQKKENAWKAYLEWMNTQKEESKMNDLVNHPNHYTFGSIEVIDYIRDKMTPDEFQGYCMGNILKYISRHKHKNGVEDLKKAQVYLGWLIESEEGAK